MIGARRARWLLLSGDWVSGATAADWGLVNEAVAGADLLDRVDELAGTLAERSPLLSAAIKQAMQLGEGLDVGAALAAERPLFLDHMASEDARIGLRAFATKTTPRFIGR
jgi:enoyl-CoA hydratase/carnithine racemase